MIYSRLCLQNRQHQDPTCTTQPDTRIQGHHQSKIDLGDSTDPHHLDTMREKDPHLFTTEIVSTDIRIDPNHTVSHIHADHVTDMDLHVMVKITNHVIVLDETPR